MMVRRVMCVGVLAIAAPVCALPAFAQTPAPAVVHVRVADPHGTPIAGADVAVLDDRQQNALIVATSDSAGAHTFTIVPDSAHYRVAVRKIGFVATTRRLLLHPGDTTTIEVRLVTSASVVTLPTVVTREQYHLTNDPGYWDGFDVRCAQKAVSCVEGDSLAERPNGFGTLLNRIPGLVPVESSAGTTAAPVMYKTEPGRCEPTYYVNGFRWSLGWRVLMDSYSPREIKGIEVYPSGQPHPGRFTSDSPVCGVVVVWVK